MLSLTTFSVVTLLLNMQLCLFAGAASVVQDAQVSASQTRAQQGDTDRIVTDFMASEAESRLAFSRYSFKRDLLIQSIRSDGNVTGEYHRISQFIIDDKGNRQEKVVTFPKPTLNGVILTKDDIEDFDGVSQFLLTPPGADNYEFSYVSQEQAGGMVLSVFDVRPKPKAVKKGRLFEGRIWVDAKSKKIIVLYGRKVMATNQVFPVMRINRVLTDGSYYFPSSISSDQQLMFPTGGSVHLRISVQYTDYTRT